MIELVCSLDEHDLMYEWSCVEIGQDSDSGDLFFRYGAGCSCNCINDCTWESLNCEQALTDLLSYVDSMKVSPTDRVEFISEVQSLFKRRK